MSFLVKISALLMYKQFFNKCWASLAFECSYMVPDLEKAFLERGITGINSITASIQGIWKVLLFHIPSFFV